VTGTVSAAASGALPDYAPIPPEALGPPLNKDGYFVGQISGNLYWVTDSYYSAMFLTTREGVVLADAPPTIGNNLQRAINDVTQANGMPAKVTHMIYSHSHADHIGASSLLGDDVVRIAHSECRRLLLRDNDTNRPAPTVTFDDRYALTVGGERLELAYHGPNHSPDNIFIHAPDHEALMLVDVFAPGWVPFKSLVISQDFPGWISAQDVALGYRWQTLVPGHLGRLGTRADVDLQIQYVSDLIASVRAAITSFDPTPLFAKYGGNPWALFQQYFEGAARQAAEPVIAKYLGKLAGADVLTVDNAVSLVESVRMDYGLLGPFGIHP
jgi:glyoxylase-like metal-dependent hydrolase (beta-lactamase superfamily II)